MNGTHLVLAGRRVVPNWYSGFQIGCSTSVDDEVKLLFGAEEIRIEEFFEGDVQTFGYARDILDGNVPLPRFYLSEICSRHPNRVSERVLAHTALSAEFFNS